MTRGVIKEVLREAGEQELLSENKQSQGCDQRKVPVSHKEKRTNETHQS